MEYRHNEIVKSDCDGAVVFCSSYTTGDTDWVEYCCTKCGHFLKTVSLHSHVPHDWATDLGMSEEPEPAKLWCCGCCGKTEEVKPGENLQARHGCSRCGKAMLPLVPVTPGCHPSPGMAYRLTGEDFVGVLIRMDESDAASFRVFEGLCVGSESEHMTMRAAFGSEEGLDRWLMEEGVQIIARII